MTGTIVLDGAGGAKEYVGGYDDWLRQDREEAAARVGVKTTTRKTPETSASARLLSQPLKTGLRRLSYKEQRALEAHRQELAGLPLRIEALETERDRLSAAMGDPAFYRRDGAGIARTVSRLKELEEELAQAYRRWEEIDTLEG